MGRVPWVSALHQGLLRAPSRPSLGHMESSSLPLQLPQLGVVLTALSLSCKPVACPSPLLACAVLAHMLPSLHSSGSWRGGRQVQEQSPTGGGRNGCGVSLGKELIWFGARQGDLQRLRNAGKRGKGRTHPTGWISSSRLKGGRVAKINEVLVGEGLRRQEVLVTSSHR